MEKKAPIPKDAWDNIAWNGEAQGGGLVRKSHSGTMAGTWTYVATYSGAQGNVGLVVMWNTTLSEAPPPFTYDGKTRAFDHHPYMWDQIVHRVTSWPSHDQFFSTFVRTWYAGPPGGGASAALRFGQASNTSSPQDRNDFAFWEPDTGTWHIYDGETGGLRRSVQYGGRNDWPVPGDYDGNGAINLAIWRPTDRSWHIQGSPLNGTVLGEPGDIPVPGDYDGDGKTDIAVWRPSNGTWIIRLSSTGELRTIQYGKAGDIPVPADYSGDGITDSAIWRPGDGAWHIVDSATKNGRTVKFGKAGDIPVPGDYNGDKIADLAVFRDGTWLIRESLVGAERENTWGKPGDVPIPADYDCDGVTDLAVCRPVFGGFEVLIERSRDYTERKIFRTGDGLVPLGCIGGRSKPLPLAPPPTINPKLVPG